MRFICNKVRKASLAYTDPGTQRSKPIDGFEVFLAPEASQHATQGGIAEMKLTVMTDCPYKQGDVYDLAL